MASPFPNTWLSTKEAARFLGIHPDTLRRWRREGIGPRYSRIGRLIRYHVDTLDEWLRSKEQDSQQGGDV